MKLSQQQIETFRADGVLPLGRVIDEATVADAREHLEALRARDLMDCPGGDKALKTFRLLNASAVDDWFLKIVTCDAVLDAAESILGPNVQYYQDNVFYKPARNGDESAWHQDNVWWRADPPNMLTIWIALDDTDVENGAVHYVPGSHAGLIEPTMVVNDANGMTYKLLAPEQVDKTKAVSFNVPAGHAVMHHCLTVHGAPPNSSDRLRRGYTVHLAQAGVVELDETRNPMLRGKAAVK